MKKEWWIAIAVAVLVLCVTTISIFLVTINKAPTYLSEEYYNTSSFIDVDASQFSELQEKKETFITVIYQPDCVTSADFEKVLEELMQIHNIGIVKIKFSDISETTLSDHIKFYPSAAVIKNGEVREYLDANSEEDEWYYESVDSFTQWVSRYVMLDQREKSE